MKEKLEAYGSELAEILNFNGDDEATILNQYEAGGTIEQIADQIMQDKNIDKIYREPITAEIKRLIEEHQEQEKVA